MDVDLIVQYSWNILSWVPATTVSDPAQRERLRGSTLLRTTPTGGHDCLLPPSLHLEWAPQWAKYGLTARAHPAQAVSDFGELQSLLIR